MVDKIREPRRVLRGHDLRLLATAAYYDLADAEERTRSTRDLELFFFRLLANLQPGLFLEAGAKEAGASRRARRRLPDSEIIAVEANPYTYARFRASKPNRRHRIDYRHQALGRQPGSATLNVRLDSDGVPLADGQASLLKRSDHIPGHEQIEVEATTIDEIFTASTADSMAMWVDVEGATEAVLGGARGSLAKTVAIFIEVEDYEFWPGQWLARDVMAHLWDAGLTPVARDFQSSRQQNVVFVADRVLDEAPSRMALAQYHASAARPVAYVPRAISTAKVGPAG